MLFHDKQAERQAALASDPLVGPVVPDLEHMLVPFDPPTTNFVDRLRYWAETRADAVAFYYTDDVETDIQMTFRQLEGRARAIAARLHELGAAGQRVLLLYPSGLEFVAGFFGCLFAGAIAVPAYPPRRNRKVDRLEAICVDADPMFALSEAQVVDRVQTILDDSPSLQRITWLATDTWDTSAMERWKMPQLAAGDMAVLQYTSGSTGTPKGVMITHGNMMHNCGLITYGFEPDRNTGAMSWLPTFHDMGLVGGVLEPVFFGCHMVLMSPMAFLQKPIRWLRAITRYGINVSGAPNFAYDLCIKRVSESDCQGLDLSSWNVAFNGAEPVRAETLQHFTEKFAPYGFRAQTHYPCYGMAETTLIVTGHQKSERPFVCSVDANALEQHRVAPATDNSEKVRQLVSSGRALPGMKVVIVDPQTGRPLPDRRVGEIWVSGPSVAKGYWNNAEETQQKFARKIEGSNGSYMRSGDLGFQSHGQLFVTGRRKDVIIIRGRNLYPQDIERTVGASHVAVHGGSGAAMSIEQDSREQLVVIQEIDRQHRNADLDEVIAAVRQTILEEHDVSPHQVLLLKAGKLPKTSSGKLQRTFCRDQFIAGELDVLKQWTAVPDRENGEALTASTAGLPETLRTSEDLREWLIQRVASHVEVSPADIDVHQPFSRSGMDSVALVQVSGELEDCLGHEVSPTLLFSYPTIAALADHLASFAESTHATKDDWAPIVPKREVAEPIAIVGIGCQLPGVHGPESFWRQLHQGFDAIREIDSQRWDMDAYYDPDPDAVGKMYARHAGLLDHVDLFDPQFFEIAPREAIAMDPQQRLLLEVAWETLEHAGQSPDEFASNQMGVFVGISNSDYAHLQNRLGPMAIDSHTGTGTLNSIAAGRLAYVLGVQGPCLAVDTACSSSLVAVHLAVQSLREGECQSALAGGVNLILDPAPMLALSRLRALSLDGRCKTFDAAADGYGRGEGCGLVLLKRLSEAVENGDRIMAVIRGSAINHDGRSNGLTAPHRQAQEAVIRLALEDAGVQPASVSYLEAHGTGTLLGDPIEVRSAAAVYRQGRPAEQPLAMGSVKTNIGHLESAAGVAGLLKVAIALQHKTIPAHLNLKDPNPYIPWDTLPVRVPTEIEEWEPVDGRHLAAVSSFGLSGTNAHIVLERFDEPPTTPSPTERPQHLLVLSAKEPNALQSLAAAYARQLSEPNESLADVCFTASTGRARLKHRAAIIASDNDEAIKLLEGMIAGKRKAAVVSGVANSRNPARLAMLFTGQGSQYVGMGRQLYETQRTFWRVINECDVLLQDELQQPLTSVLYPDDERDDRLADSTYAQPALFAVELALYELWKSWGVVPELVMGHSLGEYAAACAAGIFSWQDALRLVAARGRLMHELPSNGDMAAVAASEQIVRQHIEACDEPVAIAAVNGPDQTVISGSFTAIESAVIRLKHYGISTSQLAVTHAFHSPSMEPMLDEFEAICRTVTFSPPQIPIADNLQGEVRGDAMASPDYWRQQIREAVRFGDAIAALDALGANVYLEVGPKPTLSGLGKHCVVGEERLWLSSLRPRRDDWSEMMRGVAELFVRDVTIDWPGFDRDYARRKVTLPNYPFQRQRYWLDESAQAPPVESDVASSQRSTPTLDMQDAFYELQWHPRSRWDQSIAHHVVEGYPAPEEVADKVRDLTDRVRSQMSLQRYQRLNGDLDQLSIGYVYGALRKIGWSAQPGATVTAKEAAEQLGIVPNQRRLWSRLLDMLGEHGLLKVEGDAWSAVTQLPEDTDPVQLHSRLEQEYPECIAELQLLSQCGSRLVEVLRGTVDPLQVLFPSGSSAAVEKLYRDSPFARTLNALVAATVQSFVDSLPVSRAIRILEIGAGTGGTTAHLLPGLPADRTEYLFTDVSEMFTRAAQDKFHEFPFVRYGLLDIETDPREQGFANHQFDLILGANVLHATRDLRETLAHARQLLAPGGSLVVLESTRPQRWLDLVFGLTDGWWRFADSSLRSNHALLAPKQWLELMETCGFDHAVALPETLDHDLVEAPPQAVLVARADESICSSAVNSTKETKQPAKDVGSWLILADRNGVGDKLAEDLTRRGGRAVCALHRDGFTDAIQQFGDDPCRGVVHLWSLDGVEESELSNGLLEEAQVRGAASVPGLLQALENRGGNQKPHVWFVTGGAQPIGNGLTPSGLAQSPLWGIARVVSGELPGYWGGLVDLDAGAPANVAAEQLLDEILSPDDEDQVAYRDGQRYAARLAPRQNTAPADQRPLRCRADGSYLVTGGLGDLGLRVAEWLVEKGARSLVLTGRRQISADDPRALRLQQLRSQNVAVHLAAVDVADQPAMSSLLEELAEQGWPPLRGVVHCAGVTSARPLLELEGQQVLDCLRPKVQGTWVLDQIVDWSQLDFFTNFSSGAALLGSPMLGSYAAANAFQDAMAHSRRAGGCPALSVNWGFWSKIGMVARSQREAGRGFAPQGMRSFTPEQGLWALEQLLQQQACQATVMPVDWAQWCHYHPSAGSSPMFSNLLPKSIGEENRSDETPPISRQQLLELPESEREAILQQYLAHQLGRVLRISADELDVNQPLNQLGIDSLMAVELRNRVDLHLGVAIPVADLLQEPTVCQLAKTIMNNFSGESNLPELVATLSVPDETPNHDRPATEEEAMSALETLASLDELTDEEVEAKLKRMLGDDHIIVT